MQREAVAVNIAGKYSLYWALQLTESVQIIHFDQNKNGDNFLHCVYLISFGEMERNPYPTPIYLKNKSDFANVITFNASPWHWL